MSFFFSDVLALYALRCACTVYPPTLTIKVEYMHGSDIVHRDIKLENILLGGSGRIDAKLVDFGFSAHVKNRRLLHVFCGALCGGRCCLALQHHEWSIGSHSGRRRVRLRLAVVTRHSHGTSRGSGLDGS